MDGIIAYFTRILDRGKCPEPYTRHEVLTNEFANNLQDLVFPSRSSNGSVMLFVTSDRTKQAACAETIKTLQAWYDRIHARI